MSDAIGWIREVVLDCADPWALARFWADLFGGTPQPAQFPAGGGGELASAIVLAAQDVAPMPGFAAPGAAVDLTLEVRRADGSSYTTHTRLSVPTPERRAAVATPGTRLSVRIDPNDPARVEIDSYGQF